MKKETIYNRSLELLDQFILERSADELASYISKHADPNIKGPTFDEYLQILQSELKRIDWKSCTGELIPIHQADIIKYFIEEHYYYYSPPHIDKIKKTYKKGSVMVTEPFFLL